MHTQAISAALISVIALSFVALLQRQLCRLSRQGSDASFVLPLARTIADVIAVTPEPARMGVIARLEDSRFRSVNVVVYSERGEVYADSSVPASGKLPMPASTRQTEVFEMVKEKGVFDAAAGVHGTVFRPCNPRGGEKTTTSVAAVRVEGTTMLVAVCACGNENF